MSAWEPTRWTQIGRLGVPDADAREAAWNFLFERYRPVFVAYAGWCLRRMGGATLARNDAEEVVDAFLAACLEKDWLSRADREKGRFRTFVRRVLARFARDWMARRTARKRMPDAGPPKQVEDLAALAGGDDPGEAGEALDRDWAERVIGLALAAVQARSPRNARAVELLRADPDPDKDLLALRLEVRPRQVPVTLFRARRMFAEELWAQVRETCASEEDFLEERRFLRPWLGRYLDEDTQASLFG